MGIKQEPYFNSVYLKQDLCKGCINCIKRCPTEAIRVRNGKAVITTEFCIDCGKCIRICKEHAKVAKRDSMSILDNYKYKVALVPPSLYGQFNNLDDVNIVLTGLKRMGFDDVFEVSAAAEIVSELSRKYISENKDKLPIISTACPTVVKLISIRFPNLIEHLLPIAAPVDIAASLARKKAIEDTELAKEDIGIIFLTPCPAKVSAVRNPIGIEESEIDGVIAIKDVYPLLSNRYMREAMDNIEELATSGKIGITWGRTGGEVAGLLTDNYLAADGINNVIDILEDLEDQKLTDLEFIELNACDGGCVGGVLNVENPFMAKAKLDRLRKYMPISRSNKKMYGEEYVEKISKWEKDVTYKPVFTLGENMMDSFVKMNQATELCNMFPGLDCGSCGAPTCKALAEDIVRGVASKKDCVHILRELYEEVISEDDD